MNDTKYIFFQYIENVFSTIWIWIPLAIVVCYVTIRNNSWKMFFVNMFSFVFLFILNIYLNKVWKGETLEVIGGFCTIMCFLLYLIQSKRFVIPFLMSVIVLYVTARDISMIMYQIFQSLIISITLFFFHQFIVNKLMKEKKSYVSVEYTKGGYRVRDINVLMLFCLLTLYFIIMIGFFYFIGL